MIKTKIEILKFRIMNLKLFQLLKQIKLLLFVLMLIIGTSLSAQASGTIMTSKTVTLSEKKISLNQLLWKLKKQTDIVFTYNTSDIEKVSITDLNVVNKTVNEVLDQCLKNTNLEYKSVEGTIVIKQKVVEKTKEAQQKPSSMTIKGLIQDSYGEALIGVVITVKGTNNGTITDIDGNYELENVIGGQTIVISYVGKETIERVIKAGETVLNITMDDRADVLKDVVVTGYQTISRERAVGSFGIVTSKDIENKTQSNILQRLEGLVPGMNNEGSTDNSGNKLLTIRGVSTVMANKNPLYVVDGIPYEGDINFINPNDVTNVSVLKDATANSIYGARASNGVIVITTRKGQSGKVVTRYSGSVKFVPKLDLNYLNLINSSDMVDLQVDGFNFKHSARSPKYGYNPVIDLLYQREAGDLTDSELQDKLDVYRNLNNRGQIEDEFVRTSVIHQHNLSVSGGNDKNTYLFSVNYYQSSPNQKYSNYWRLGANLRDDIKFNNWLEGDILFSSNYTHNRDYIGAANRTYTGVPSYQDLIVNTPSYYMIRDDQDNPINFPNRRSDSEIDRIMNLGLLDENHSPVLNHKQVRLTEKTNHHRIQLGLKAKIIEGLSASVKMQLETGSLENTELFSGESTAVRHMVNNAATVDKSGKVTFNVPKGGQLKKERAEHFSYTLRGQLDYSKEFDKHSIVALLGAERRLIRDKYNNDYYMGYDHSTLEINSINMTDLLDLRGTEALYNSFQWDYSDYINMRHIENRFISFYANASYTYDYKYSLSGSIRIDQSDLFGTDPKYQYRPLWSLGAGWHMKQENFLKDASWIDQLNLRLTYGIGGNVAKDAGPYVKFAARGVDRYTRESAIVADAPANKNLRWEKTATTNFGVDMSILDSRLGLSVDLYNKETTDLLGYKDVNSFLGWQRVLLNYGDMYNRGIEVSLNVTPVKNRNVTWETTLNFGYNKNKLINMKSAILRYLHIQQEGLM